MIRALLVDDEKHAIDDLLRLLRSVDDQVKVVGTASTIEEALQAQKRLQPDLVFLDVEIYDKTGFDFLKRIPEIDFDLIFTTAHTSYAVQAFRYSALDFLLKPIDRKQFKEAITKVIQKKDKENGLQENIRLLLDNIHAKTPNNRVFIPNHKGYDVIDTNQVLYLKGDENYTHIFSLDHYKTTIPRTILWFEGLLKGLPFYRVHKSYMINTNHIEAYHKANGGEVILKGDIEIPISLRRKERFIREVIGNKKR